MVSRNKSNGNPCKCDGLKPVQVVRILYIIFFEEIAIPKSGRDKRTISFMEGTEGREIEVVVVVV